MKNPKKFTWKQIFNAETKEIDVQLIISGMYFIRFNFSDALEAFQYDVVVQHPLGKCL
jgi:hypothetical protein